MAPGRVLILGGGIIGLCTAWHLARRGVQVTVIERDRIGASASAGNAGIVALGHTPLPRPGLARRALGWMLDPGSPLYIPPRADPSLARWLWDFQRACTDARVRTCMEVLGPLGRLSLAIWQDMLADIGQDCLWRQAGWLEVFTTEAGRRHAAREAAVTRSFGVDVTPLDATALRSQEPALTERVLGAEAYPESCIVDPGRFLTGLAARLQQNGVEIREGAPAVRLVRRDRRCVGATLATGEIVGADAVVLAAGAWSGPLAHAVGVRLPLQAGKGYHLDLEAPSPSLRSGCVIVESSVAMTPLADVLRLAGTLEFSGLNLRLRRRRVDMLRTGAAPVVRGVAQATEREAWCGLRPCLADGLPVIDRAPGCPGLVLATGHAKMGLTHGPATGRLVCDLLLDETPALDLHLLRADRL